LVLKYIRLNSYASDALETQLVPPGLLVRNNNNNNNNYDNLYGAVTRPYRYKGALTHLSAHCVTRQTAQAT